MRRIVTVSYVDPMYGSVVEDYGPFENNQHLAAWLDVQDRAVTFGNHFRMEVKLLGSVSVPVPGATKRPPRKTAATRGRTNA